MARNRAAAAADDAPPAGPVDREELQSRFEALLGRPGPGEAAARDEFIAQVFDDYRPEELPGLTADDLAAALASFWGVARGMDSAAPAIRLSPAKGAGGRDLAAQLLEIVQPDRPFIVDSVMGEVGEAGAEVRAMFHPVIGTRRRRLSLIQVWLRPLTADRGAALIERVEGALADVLIAVHDFKAMMAQLDETIAELEEAAPGDPKILAEDLEFLRWMRAGHFVFLGTRCYEYPRTKDGGYAAEEPLIQPQQSLGVLRDESRFVLRRANEPAVLSAALRRNLEMAEPVVVAKSNLRSRVHRRVYMDYVGVRRYGRDRKPKGEVRFVGLFTHQAYNESAHDTPLLRGKVAKVMAAAGFPRGSHNAKRLANILDTYPRDELFQIRSEELLEKALGILHLSDRPRVKLFVRNDAFDRFVSVLMFTPRDRYDARLRAAAGDILASAWGGRITSFFPNFSDSPLAWVHYIVAVTPGDHPEPDVSEVERRIALAARTWGDALEAALLAGAPQQAGARLAAWRDAFPAGYRDLYGAEEAIADMAAIEGMAPGETLEVRAYRHRTDSPKSFRFKLYRRGEAPAPLSDVLPILENAGLFALVEEGFPLTPLAPDGRTQRFWAHEFLIADERGERLAFANVKAPFEAAFKAIWSGRAENDGFNRLVLELGCHWREAALVRAVARYRAQSGLDPSPTVQQAALADHPQVAHLLLDLFHAKFDPAAELSIEARDARAATLQGEIELALQAVESLDADRSLRRMAAAIVAMTRTNFYQREASGEAKPHIAFKIASQELAELPSPKPFAEVFVAAPNVEAVHLRLGPVARGGIRWSDRRDDFRTEILSLVKAQQVKNAVIVPVGAKGGFFPKKLPRGGDAAAVRAEAVAAYKTFLKGLLDLTDNVDAKGAVLHPEGLVIHDGEDPYLVVAADKGTASFSDIANGLARDYGFWLDDAFASGGSAGYDHKAMGITARGAWVAIQRHFRELGKDIQTEPTTVAGVGDMSGDVFGNGMLLSRALRLVAAFDHRHIFIDPDPDPEAAFAERQRLFDLPASSWDDYDRSRISAGGGVWPRTQKSIPLSAEVCALLDLEAEALTANEIIRAILKARVDLLYFGGIGAYVKAASESQLEVGDKANDAVRVDGRELRCKVVGEGANLAVTQAGRIEYARAGGRIDTDAIDNSAGVDTSDHEVNIKILAGAAISAGTLAPAAREPLLRAMTDEVASHVLAHNYDQTLALSLLQAEGPAGLESHAAFMADLEERGRLDRVLEGLPDAAEIGRRAAAGQGLTRPELCVLLAYGKLDLFEDVIASNAPDDPWFETVLTSYFPKELAHLEAQMRRHRLRREIIATVIGNDLVNLCGPTFPRRARAAAGCDIAALVKGFEAARQVLRLSEAWVRVEKLDGRAPAAAQTALFSELAFALRGQTFWLARRAGRQGGGVAALIDAYRPAVDALKKLVPAALSAFEQKAAVRRAGAWIKAGAPRDIAHSVALMRPLALAATPVSDLAAAKGWALAQTAFLYHRVGGLFGFDRLRAAADARRPDDPFERAAIRRLLQDTLAEQTALAGAVMDVSAPEKGADPARQAALAVAAWTHSRAGQARAAKETLQSIERAGGGWTFAKLALANAALRELAEG
ncbi:MAG TPA: NAD-glutamate dehydrogenase [Caulobacteraceae bacterium]|nr:NAD-glutamate dehydrogenase [Caulobacteraceae bacterium]